MTQCVKGTVYVGPCAVQAYSEKFRKAGVTVDCTGTQHLYVSIPARTLRQAEDTLFNMLRNAYGYVFASNMRMKLLSRK